MSNPKHLNLTPRAFLVSLNPPLAEQFGKDGVTPARGRFSNAATAALAAARADGFLFLGDEGNENNPAPEVKAPRAAATPKAPAAPKPAPAPAAPQVVLPTVNPKEVRAWAKANGHEVGDRGRLNQTVVSAFLASGGKPVGPRAARVATPLDMPKVRKETTGFVYAPRPQGAPKHVSEPLVRVATCGSCNRGVAFCNEPQGPSAPAYLGGAILSLDKPV